MLVRQKHGFKKQNAKLGSKLIFNVTLVTIFVLLILLALPGMVFAQEATADHGFDLEANGSVLTFAHQPEDNKILVGGKFTRIGGKHTGRLARLHPVSTLLDIISTIIWLITLSLAIFLMIKAYRHEAFKLPVAGNIAEKQLQGDFY